MKRLPRLLLVSLALTGCAYNATVTLYKTPENLSIGRMGFVAITPDSIPTDIYQEVNKEYCADVASAWKKYQKDSAYYFDKSFNYYHPDTIEISRFCKENKIDELVLSTMKFTLINYYILPVPGAYMESLHADIAMKVFNCKGKLILSNSFNTQYGGGPTRESTPVRMAVEASVTGSLKGILKEMKTPGDPYF